MGTYTPKPYKKFCRKSGKWVTVKPEPVEYKSKSIRKEILCNSKESKK